MSAPAARVYRPASARERVVVAIPAGPAVGDRQEWLREVCGAGTRPEWRLTKRGLRALYVARPHFRRVVEAVARTFGDVEVIVDHTTTSVCGALCRDATGDECECSCGGENHAGQAWRKEWIKVSEHWLVMHQRKRAHYRVTRAQLDRADAEAAR